jgi:hypothetical protein
MVKWDKTLGTANGDLSLQTEWDSNAVIELFQVGVESAAVSPPG